MKFSRLALALGATLVMILPVGGCSSKTDDKQPKLVGGPDNPNARPVGRGLGGAPGKPTAAPQAAPVTKN